MARPGRPIEAANGGANDEGRGDRAADPGDAVARDAKAAPRRARWWSAWALAGAVIATYGLSLGGDFLNYDDPWLIRDNPILEQSARGALTAIWTDLRDEVRQPLGAEYLPVRDTVGWAELHLLGNSPHRLRAVSLLLYLAALLILRAYLRRTLADPRVAEVAAWLFALHPVHAESVAWLAGQKDLLALLFVVAALWTYVAATPASRKSHARTWAVPVFVLLACLSKSVAVVAPLLLLAHDAFVRRRPKIVPLLIAGAAAALALMIHVRVGRAAGMLAPFAGGNRWATAATMGPVWLRYLGRSLVPVTLSIDPAVRVRAASAALGYLAYVPLLVLAGAAAWAWRRRGARLPAFALAWFAVPLLPTSQVIAPLQNLMADRYLLLAVLGPCLALAWGACALDQRWSRPALAAGIILMAGALSFARAEVFMDSVSLWQDAIAKNPGSARAHYQLGLAWRAQRQLPEAEAALRQATTLAPADDVARMASNNLAALLTQTGRAPEALALLRQTVARFPNDPRALNNLAELTARLGQDQEARRLFDTLVRRFPTYAPGWRNWQLRYGATVPASDPGLAPSEARSP